MNGEAKPLVYVSPGVAGRDRSANWRGRKAYSAERGVGFNASIDGALYNQRDPNYIIKHEKPVHRQMQELSLGGHSNEEIARITGYTAAYVGNVLQQGWAQMHMIDETKKKVQDELRELLEAQAIPTLTRIVNLASSATSEAVKLDANKTLWDRFLGKPNQPVSTNDAPAETLSNTELARRAAIALSSIGTDGQEPTAVEPNRPPDPSGVPSPTGDSQ